VSGGIPGLRLLHCPQGSFAFRASVAPGEDMRASGTCVEPYFDVFAPLFSIDTIPVIFSDNPEQPARGTNAQESCGRW